MPTSKKNTDDTAAVLEKIEKMPEPFRSMGERLHALIVETVPGICPRVWYGMPGYAKTASSPVVCYFRSDHYMTFGLTEKARFDFGASPHGMCETAWFFEGMNEQAVEKIKRVLRAGVE